MVNRNGRKAVRTIWLLSDRWGAVSGHCPPLLINGRGACERRITWHLHYLPWPDNTYN